jgi:hypothetical protein
MERLTDGMATSTFSLPASLDMDDGSDHTSMAYPSLVQDMVQQIIDAPTNGQSGGSHVLFVTWVLSSPFLLSAC